MSLQAPAVAPHEEAPVQLATPFCLIGLAGGWLTADAFRIEADEPVRWLLTGTTPLVAAALGAYLTRRVWPLLGRPSWVRRGWLVASLLVTAATLIAGVVNGVFIGLLLAGPVGMLFGVYFGFICALPFIPALGAVLLPALRVGRARAGSVVDRSDRRAVWAATAAAVALAALIVPALSGFTALSDVARRAAEGACAVLAALFVADAVVLTRVLKAQGGDAPGAQDGVAAELDEAAREAPGGPAGQRPAYLDLGLGDEARVETLPPQHAYRGATRVLRVVRGSRARAVRALRGGVALAGLALAAGAALWVQWWGGGGPR